MQNCISCGQTYDPTQKASILQQAEQSQSAEQKQRAAQKRFSKLSARYPQTCLRCIKTELVLSKQQYQSNLKLGAIELNIAREALHKASAKHTSL
ncbi:MAG: hypothetical protein PF440_04830, partial [Thiomicrorhabdus sp.]|nr:hypothetical protein [Thiomicrorhabdus sp.]